MSIWCFTIHFRQHCICVIFRPTKDCKRFEDKTNKLTRQLCRNSLLKRSKRYFRGVKSAFRFTNSAMGLWFLRFLSSPDYFNYKIYFFRRRRVLTLIYCCFISVFLGSFLILCTLSTVSKVLTISNSFVFYLIQLCVYSYYYLFINKKGYI